MSTTRPAKYATLLTAASAGLKTPPSLLIDNINDTKLIDEFIAQASANNRFIVRSAFSAEDGAGQSFAGHFYSSNAVNAESLTETITTTWAENQRIAAQFNIEGELSLLVQEYVEHEIGGVLFAPWSFFSDYACVELSRGGVQDVVAGQADTAIIVLDASADSPLALPADLAFLLPELQAVCEKLRRVFDYPVDCEWAWSVAWRELVILQVRPQTHAVGPVLSLPLDKQPTLPVGNWQYTALSESLGRVSPLSFSLLQQLYQDLKPALRHIGCVAADSDFLLHLPDGTVLVDAVKERQFYASTRFGGFWRGFRAEQVRQRLIRDADVTNTETSAPFTYGLLSTRFNDWMLSNFLSDGEGRVQKPAPHAYELSWHNATDFVVADTASVNNAGSWAALNAQGRTVFMRTLGTLKQMLAAHPERAFSNWRDYQAGIYNITDLLAKQRALAALAIYDYASATNGEVASDQLSLAANHVVTGKVCIVLQPGQHHGELPKDCILIAPYFDNRWAAAISGLRGIVVRRGSHLAHSVLVAREMGVPYCVLPELNMAAFESGAMFTLDPIQKTLTQAL